MGKKGVFDILKNVQPSTTTTLTDLNVTGLNLYEGTYEPGEVISYNFIGTMPSATSIATLNAEIASQTIFGANTKPYFPSQLITSSPDIDVYELVYWGRDSRSNDTIRQSASLLVPKVIVDSTIVSCKHGTILNTYQGATTWNFMKNILEGDTAEATILGTLVSGGPWYFATAGYITVTADNPGYGISNGAYNYYDTYGEAFSQYDAVSATSDLILKAPSLFATPGNASSYVLPHNVISCGYSLGAACTFVSQLIALDTVNFKLINTICGAPINTYAYVNKTVYNNTAGVTPTSTVAYITNLVFQLLIANTSIQQASLIGTKPSIISGVLPLFNQLNLDTPTEANVNTFLAKVISLTQIATGGTGIVGADGSTPFASTAQNPPYVVPSAIFNANTLLSNYLQTTWFTNYFQDWSSLANTPINCLYSLQDELVCPNTTPPLNIGGGVYIPLPYLGGGTDLTDTALSSFISSTNAPYGNGLNRSDYSNTNPVATNSNINDLQDENVARILASESTGACSNRRYTTTGLTPTLTGSSGLQHNGFANTIYQTVIRKYLINRVA